MRKKNTEHGNALIYVLIAIVLFAALGFTLSRQMTDSDTGELDAAKADFHAAQIIAYAAQAKSAVDQMIFTGSGVGDLVFTQPGEAGYNTAPHIHKVFHPEGGGVTVGTLPPAAVLEISTPPAAGWHMGRFNTVGWTKSTGTDVILTAHQITKTVCEALNDKITGSKTVPALSGDLDDYLVDTATDNDLTAAACAACEGHMSLCVSNNAVSAYSFYSVVADR